MLKWLGEIIICIGVVLKSLWLAFIGLIDTAILIIVKKIRYTTYSIKLILWTYILTRNNPTEYQLSYFDKRFEDIAKSETEDIAYMIADTVIAELKGCVRELKGKRNGRNTNK